MLQTCKLILIFKMSYLYITQLQEIFDSSSWDDLHLLFIRQIKNQLYFVKQNKKYATSLSQNQILP